MKKRRLTLVLVLTLVLGLLLTACGGKGGDKDDEGGSGSSKKKTVVGKWTCEVNLGDAMNDQLSGELGDLADYMDFDDVSFKLKFNFRDDGTYTIAVDEKSLEKMGDNLEDTLRDGMTNYLEDVIEENGADMSVDELLDQSGMDLDDYIDEAMGQFDLEDAADSMNTEGQYKAEDGKLYTSNDVDEEPDEDEYMDYEFNDGNLELGEGNQDAGAFADCLPLVLERD